MPTHLRNLQSICAFLQLHTHQCLSARLHAFQDDSCLMTWRVKLVHMHRSFKVNLSVLTTHIHDRRDECFQSVSNLLYFPFWEGVCASLASQTVRQPPYNVRSVCCSSNVPLDVFRKLVNASRPRPNGPLELCLPQLFRLLRRHCRDLFPAGIECTVLSSICSLKTPRITVVPATFIFQCEFVSMPARCTIFMGSHNGISSAPHY